jgi:hypothetical protein
MTELSLESKAIIRNSQWLPLSLQTLTWNAALKDVRLASKVRSLQKLILGTNSQHLIDLDAFSDRVFQMPILRELSLTRSKKCEEARNQRMLRRACVALEEKEEYEVNISNKYYSIFRKSHQ